MLELRHLRYFVAVAEELNFSRAAERLHMAQPPLSAAIRQLEQELGTELLQRTTREVRLTEAGSTFLEGARRTLAELDRARADAQRAAAGEIGHLRVGFSWSARFETLPAIGRAFRLTHPDVSLLTEEMWNARMLPALRSGLIDVALSLCPEVAAEFSYLPLRTEPVVALIAQSHPLAGSHEIDLRALVDEDFLLFPRELAPRLYDFMTGLCRRADFEPRVRGESFHSGWELQILSDVDVVALAPASVALDLPEGITAAVITDPPDQLETTMVWRTDDTSPTGRAFREAAQAVFSDSLAGRTESKWSGSRPDDISPVSLQTRSVLRSTRDSVKLIPSKHQGGQAMSVSAGDQRTHATGKINVKTYEPTAYDQPADGPVLTRIHVVEDFSGDIAGQGVATFLQTTRADDEASFVGVERVSGSVGGRSGTFVLQDEGTLKGSTVSGTWFVVPGSGTGELTGLRGVGGFTAELGQGADITLDYWFD